MTKRKPPRASTPMLGSSGAPVGVGGTWRDPAGPEAPDRGPLREYRPEREEAPINGVFIDAFGWFFRGVDEETETIQYDFRFRAYDGAGEGGVISVWTNPNSHLSPDPEGPPDAVLEIPQPLTPPTDRFIEANQVFDNDTSPLTRIPAKTFEPKYVYVQFDTNAGESSGLVSVRVPPRMPGLDWDGKFNPEIPNDDGWFIGSLRDAQSEALDAVGMTESGWAALQGKNPDGSTNHLAFEKEFFKNATIVDKLFANNVFSLSIVTKVFAAGSILADRITANALDAITANLGLITAGRMRSAEGPGAEEGLMDIHLDSRVITIKDKFGQTRVQLGKLTTSDTGWGITLLDADGGIILTTDKALVGGSGALGDGVIFGKNIAADTIGADQISAEDLFLGNTLTVMGVSNLGYINGGFLANGTATGPAIRTSKNDPNSEGGTVPWEAGQGVTPIQDRDSFVDLCATGTEAVLKINGLEMRADGTSDWADAPSQVRNPPGLMSVDFDGIWTGSGTSYETFWDTTATTNDTLHRIKLTYYRDGTQIDELTNILPSATQPHVRVIAGGLLAQDVGVTVTLTTTGGATINHIPLAHKPHS